MDNIPPEAMKALDNISTDKFRHLLNRIWEEEQIPEDWTKEILVKLTKKGGRSICGNWKGTKLFSVHSKVNAISSSYDEKGSGKGTIKEMNWLVSDRKGHIQIKLQP